jgi:hypothetical protein
MRLKNPSTAAVRYLKPAGLGEFLRSVLGSEETGDGHKEESMKKRGLILTAGVCCFILSIGIGWTSPISWPSARQAGTSSPSLKAIELGGCKISPLSVYFWRDWMPIVAQPGADRGSALYAKVKLLVDNSAGGATVLSFKANVFDERGQSYPATFSVQPDYRLLPQSVNESYSSLDEQGKKEALAKYHVVWDGVLKPGEVREVELLSHDGPYLPVGSRVYVEFIFTDQQGRSASVKTPSDAINRTD